MFVSVYLFLVFVGGAVSLSRRLDVHEHLRIEKKEEKSEIAREARPNEYEKKENEKLFRMKHKTGKY